MAKPIILIQAGGTSSVATGGIVINSLARPRPPVITIPKQVCGLVPLWPCNPNECRDNVQQLGCYFNPVFGNLGETQPSYKNDFNSFLIDCGTGFDYEFVIQKNTNLFYNQINEWEWNDIETVIGNTSGVFNPLGSIPNHPTYMEFAFNWGLVVANYGQGFYRLKVNQIKNNGYSSQASITISSSPNPWTGSINGYIVVGAITYNFSCSGTEEQNFIYIASLINSLTSSSSPYTAIPHTNGITISGQNGSADNGTHVAYLTHIIISSSSQGSDILSLTGGGSQTFTRLCALLSEIFQLYLWRCELAEGTIKLESWLTGNIGSVDTDGLIFNLCGINVYDSIRFRGFFGEKKFNSDQTYLEYGFQTGKDFGTIEQVRNKSVPSYKMNSHLLPMWAHNRIAIYAAIMADTIYVSDYNFNNSDYFIQRKNIKLKQGQEYAPKYLDKERFDKSMRYWQRRGTVELEFMAGIQSIIKNVCCYRVNTIHPKLRAGSYNSDYSDDYDN